MVKIICGACAKPLSIDETKLPEKEVSFPCPLCKTKLLVDKREIDPASEAPHTAAVANGAPQPDAGPAVQAPAAAAEIPDAAAEGASTDPGKRALIVGENPAEVQQAARALGYSPVHRPTVPEGRDYYLQEFPEIVFVVPSAVSQPPMEDLVPLTSVGPIERRQGFFILVGDNLRSLDGNAAFLYGVNLVVAKKDLGSIKQIYNDARKDHDRYTRAFKLFAEEEY